MSRKNYIINLSMMSTDELIREHEAVSDMIPQLDFNGTCKLLWKGMLNLVEDEMENRNVDTLFGVA